VNALFDGPLYKRSINVNFVILIENGYVLQDYWKGDVLRHTANTMKEMVEERRNGFVSLH
jgi:hypothetical protein